MESGYIEAQSDNLPKIDPIMMASFFGNNPDFIGAEIKSAKVARSSREDYGDNAVGYVQLKRDGDLCTVKAKITPEHSVRKKPYGVTLICDEKEDTVISVQCEGCAAKLGGCKHAVAFLTWVHRRSEEPSRTSVNCYWKKSKLSSVGTSLKFIKCKDFGHGTTAATTPGNGSFLSAVVDIAKESATDTQLMRYFKKPSAIQNLSLNFLMHLYVKHNIADNFIDFCKTHMPAEVCREASVATLEQSDCPLWFELRFARITASKAYEAAHCKTLQGTLVETILGASKFKDTDAMKRGRSLEDLVLKKVSSSTGKINKCGLVLNSKSPILGASPDGFGSDFIVEVKCPASEKSFKTYIRDGRVAPKYMAQVQLQMYFTQKNKGFFCVAHHNFEETGNVEIINVQFDDKYCQELIEKCEDFWSAAILPVLRQNFM